MARAQVGDETTYTASFRDVSERRAQERVLAGALAGAEAALKVRDDVLSAASQDMRTPLTSIVGRLDLLVEGVARGRDTGADGRAWTSFHLTALHQAARRMRDTVESITDTMSSSRRTRGDG